MLGLEQQNFVLVNCVGICLVMIGCRVDRTLASVYVTQSDSRHVGRGR